MTDFPDETVKAATEKISSLMDEVLELRTQILVSPSSETTPVQLIDGLKDVRRRLDRTEDILVSLLRYKAIAHTLKSGLAADQEDAWDAAVTSSSKSRQINSDFSSAKERYADANLATLESLRKLRKAERFYDSCDSAVEQCRIMYRGLERVRQDIMTVMKSQQFIQNLEY